MSLTRLVLDNNMLRQLPEVVPKLPALAVLQASGNRITHLPDTLEKLQSLQALMVSENQVGTPAKSTCLFVLVTTRLICGGSMRRTSESCQHCGHLNQTACVPHGVSCCCFDLLCSCASFLTASAP